MDLMISYVDSWELRNAKDTHPSHKTAVIEVKDLIDYIEECKNKGNLIGEPGFSAGLFLSDLLKQLRQ